MSVDLNVIRLIAFSTKYIEDWALDALVDNKILI